MTLVESLPSIAAAVVALSTGGFAAFKLARNSDLHAVERIVSQQEKEIDSLRIKCDDLRKEADECKIDRSRLNDEIVRIRDDHDRTKNQLLDRLIEDKLRNKGSGLQ